MKKQNQISILFTSVGRRVELVQMFRKAAQNLDVNLVIIGADISDTAPALRFCNRFVMVPKISDISYIPELLRICKSMEISALIPTIDTDLKILSLHKDSFARIGTTVFVSAPEKIAICRDKRLTAQYFESIGLATPKTVDDVSLYNSGFPAFIKPIDGSSSIGASRVDTQEDLEIQAKQLDNYIIQPFISGTEYTVDILGDKNGNPVYITPRIRLAVRAGEVLKTKIHYQKEIISEMLRLVSNFKPCGQITVQLIRNEAEKINQYIEINPRFGGGAPLSAKAGADSATAILRILSGETVSYTPYAAEDGVVYSRFDQSICVQRNKARPIKAVIFDLDDTLYSEIDYVKSGFAQVANCLPQIPQAFEKLWDAFISGKPAIDTVLAESGIQERDTKDQCLSVYRNHFPDIKLYSGIDTLLTVLRQRNVKIGIITDGRPEGQRKKIEALGLNEKIDSIIITDELGGVKFRKPNDISFRIMQTRFGFPYEEMLYIGDNLAKDSIAPQTLGMQWIHFNNKESIYYTKNTGLDISVSTVAELTEMLMKVIE